MILRLDSPVEKERKFSRLTLANVLVPYLFSDLGYRPVPVIPIIGARKISQLQDNIASLEVSLTPEQVALLDEASKIVLGFPHDFYTHAMVRTFIYGGLRDRIMV